METKYVYIETKRIAYDAQTGGRASGGSETVCYTAVQRKDGQTPTTGGQVVDLEEYRRLHGLRDGWSIEDQGERAPRPRRHKRLVRLGVVLDCVATVGILLLVAGVLIQIFTR